MIQILLSICALAVPPQNPASFVAHQWASEEWVMPDPHADLAAANMKMARALKAPHRPGELVTLATEKFNAWRPRSWEFEPLLPMTLTVALAVALDPTATLGYEFDPVRAVVYNAWAGVRGHRSREVARVGYILWEGTRFTGADKLGPRLLESLPNDEDVQYAFIARNTSTSTKPEEFARAVGLADRLATAHPKSIRAQLAKHHVYRRRWADTKQPKDHAVALEALRTAVKLVPPDYPREYRARLEKHLREWTGG